MLIGVVTDTHENKDAVHKAIELFNRREVGLVVHAGDMIAPFTAKHFAGLKAPFKFHLGNNDGEIVMLQEAIKEFGGEFHVYDFTFTADGKTFLVQHEPQNLDALVASGAYDCIIYGHTHDVDVRTDGDTGTLVVNPGESCTWLRGLANVAIVDTDPMHAEVIDLFRTT
jgi:uncharacterized protein